MTRKRRKTRTRQQRKAIQRRITQARRRFRPRSGLSFVVFDELAEIPAALFEGDLFTVTSAGFVAKNWRP